MLRESHAGPGDSVGREVWYLHQYRQRLFIWGGRGQLSVLIQARLGAWLSGTAPAKTLQ